MRIVIHKKESTIHSSRKINSDLGSGKIDPSTLRHTTKPTGNKSG
jgi:hypothetical protein